MFKFLFLIFGFFLLLVLLLGVSVIRTFKRVLFGSSNSESNRRHASSANRQQQSAPREEPVSSKKKLFNKEDGEYIDYEEVKE
ncbi:MAG: DUF4834 family protein [Parabacteroides sp.]|nr:DUF4834 family protein [Parabacteroides sp.]